MARNFTDSIEFQEIPKALDEFGYIFHGLLGQGAIGNVYKAQCKDDRNTYAIKVMPYNQNDAGQTKYQERELQLLTRMELTKNSNVIKYFKSWIMPVSDGERLCIQMELCSLNLEAFVSNNKIGGTAIIQAEGPPKFYEQVFEQILNGLIHIHSIDWIHRDIHPGNVLIVNPNPQDIRDIHVKIADFGLARHVGIDFELPDTQWTLRERFEKLTPLPPHPQINGLRAPEMKTRNYDRRVDIYGVGLVLYFISRYPVRDYLALSPEVEAIQEGKLDLRYIHHRKDKKLIQLLQHLLAKNPAERPSVWAAKDIMFPKGDAPMIEFFARRDDEEDLTTCYLNELTLSALRDAVRRGTDVQLTNKQKLREECMINGEKRFIKRRYDADVKAMFARANENKRDVVLVISEKNEENFEL